MVKEKGEAQYFRVAQKAYDYLINSDLEIIDAWQKAAKETSEANSVIEKGCPRATFVGLCESGDLKGINFIKKNESVNYQYAKYAIEEWKKDPGISYAIMWNKVKTKFPDGALNHQGQLHVAKALINHLR